MDIKKAIIPVGGLETRFHPLSKAVPKALFPLADRPVIEYIVGEARDSDISQVIFVLSENKKNILDYFRKNQKLENALEKSENKNSKESLKILKALEKDFEDIKFSFALQHIPKGDGDAILKAKSFIKKEGFAVLFSDDVFEAKTPVLSQLIKIFQTSQKPVIGLARKPKEQVSHYGVVKVEKIANRLYKLKEIKEKPNIDEAPSDLVVTGRFILTPEIFNFLKKAPLFKGEMILVNALNLMLKEGKIIYGCEIDGQWLECGRKIDWLKSNLYLSLNHPVYGSILKEWLKKMK